MSSKPIKDGAVGSYVKTVAELDLDLDKGVNEEGEDYYPYDEVDLASYESYEAQDRVRHLRNTLVEVGREIEANLNTMRWIDERVNTVQKRDDNPRWQEYLKERDQLLKNRKQLEKQYDDQQTQYEYLKGEELKYWKLDGDNNPYLEAEDVEAHSQLFEEIVDLTHVIKTTREQRHEYIDREEKLLSDYHNNVAEDNFKKRKELGDLLERLDELRNVYDHSFTELAECADVHPRTMREYLNGKRDLPMEAFQKFEKLGPKYVELIQAVRHDDIRGKAWQDFEAHLRMLTQDHEDRYIEGGGTIGKPKYGDTHGAYDLTHGQCPECGSGQATYFDDSTPQFGTKVTRTKSNQYVNNENGDMGMDYAAKGLPQEDVLVARERTCLNPDCGHRWWTYEVNAKVLDDVYMNAHKYESISEKASEALNANNEENNNVVQLGLFGDPTKPPIGIAGLLARSMELTMKHRQQFHQTKADQSKATIQLIKGERKKGEELVPEEVSVKEKLRKLQELKGLISDEKFSQKEDALMKEFGID